MDYYIQGDAARAKEIKAAFEAKGCTLYRLASNCDSDDLIYYSLNGIVRGIKKDNLYLFEAHPGYKELEVPSKPTLKVGDWIVGMGGIFKITQYEYEHGYDLTDTTGCVVHFVSPDYVESNFRLWSIEDANDGDVLASDECCVIFKEIDGLNIKCYCTYHYIGFNPSFHINTLQNKTAFHPATKDQRDLLFKKMKEAGYEWDTEKKELRKVKEHYDIKNFKPFDKVLVRDRNDDKWQCAWFSDYDKKLPYPFITTGADYRQCVPFEGNKHLLGTCDPCSDEFVNW